VKAHSQSGRPCSHLYKGRMLKVTVDEDGYGTVHIGVDKKKTKLRVNRAVLMAFVGMPPEGMESCHNNGNPRDNTLGNLRWDTHFNNNQDRVKHGTYATGEAHPMARISAEMVLEIYRSDERGSLLAKRLGVCPTQVSSIRLGHIWSTVTGGVPRRNLHKGGSISKRHP
ncbi:MAG TPA: HNH endonuclease, partial [Pseudoduganella sp.]